MKAGDTFFPSIPGLEHRWFVLSDPVVDPDHVVIANFTSWEPDKDQACVFDPEDHPFFSKKTCVSFRDAEVVSRDWLEERQAAGQIRLSGPLSQEVLAKIRKCAGDSLHLAIEVWQILEEQQEGFPF